ncbi:mannonate dehydratase [Hymenobacter sp. CRA2]|uniref:mannonate dehydratase n=1 Tax=Hymenobacter sp. CRA2 TaxID=1955620 RepID=UPI0020C979CF|nr:mannonate dehydratase [Hymenobacter sp. CRA2]
MIPTMRWFGPSDPVSLFAIRQAGCTGVVTALHQISVGEVWPVADIQARQQLVEADNSEYSPLHWLVVESLPVHEDIKKGRPAREQYIDNYKTSLRNLAACGIRTVCYNFMPVLDWSRTNLSYEMPDGSRALRFVWQDFAVFDLCILRRPSAEADYEPEVAAAARAQFDAMSEAERQHLTNTVLLGLPGSEEDFELAGFQGLLDEYAQIDADTLRQNLHYFIQQVGPVAAEVGVNLCIHPDDPPYPLLGLPRVVSTEADLTALMAAYDHPSNGITYCTGSLGVRQDNDLPGIVRRLGHRIHFVHLRATKREENPRNFHEADHLAGDVDMYAVVRELVLQEQRRQRKGFGQPQLPMRPDHGHQMLDDLHKKTYPGYSAIGRLRGLAELRGLELGIRRSLEPDTPAATAATTDTPAAHAAARLLA